MDLRVPSTCGPFRLASRRLAARSTCAPSTRTTCGPVDADDLRAVFDADALARRRRGRLTRRSSASLPFLPSAPAALASRSSSCPTNATSTTASCWPATCSARRWRDRSEAGHLGADDRLDQLVDLPAEERLHALLLATVIAGELRGFLVVQRVGRRLDHVVVRDLLRLVPDASRMLRRRLSSGLVPRSAWTGPLAAASALFARRAALSPRGRRRQGREARPPRPCRRGA